MTSEDSTFETTMYYLRRGTNVISEKKNDDQKSIISLLLKNHCHNSENLHFLIGSGCSRPAVPLIGETFIRIKQNQSELNESTLGNYDGDNRDLEGYLTWLNNALNFFAAETDDYKRLKQAYTVSKRELLRSININYFVAAEEAGEGNNSTTTVLENYLKFYNNLFSQREFKKQLPPINVFTTNYDLFNEVTMESLGIHYTNGFNGYVARTFDPSVYRLRLVDDENRYKEKWNALRRFIKLYKIHGSIDWRYDERMKAIIQDKFNMDQPGEGVMIFPTVLKHYESQQTPYSELFREFTIALQRKNSTLIILGYGFSDDHINHLVSQSLHNEDFTLIVFGNKNESKAESFLKQHIDRHNFHFIGGNYRKKDDGHYFANVIELLGDGFENAKPA